MKKAENQKQYFFDNPLHVRWVVRGLFAICLILLGLDAILERHIEHVWEGFFGFYALYGFVACVLLVMLAREWRKLVMRDEDYYDQYSNLQGEKNNRQSEQTGSDKSD